MKVLIFVLLFSFNAFAEAPSCELNEDVDKITEVLEGSDLFLELVRVRTTLELGVDIPGITNFSVNPEVELFFTRN